MYTSKNTSINKNRPAKIYGDLIKAGLLEDKEVLDYGCGRYVEPIKKACGEGGALSLMLYDKYWKPQNLMFHAFDVIVCANVLNVIRSEIDYEAAIVDMFQMLNPLGSVYIQIYEGDRSGIGLPTKEDCWQRNEKKAEHFERICDILYSHFGNSWECKTWKGYIVINDICPF